MVSNLITRINLLLLLMNFSIFTLFGDKAIINHKYYYPFTTFLIFSLTFFNFFSTKILDLRLLKSQIFIIFILIQFIGLFSSIFYGDLIYAIKYFLYYVLLFIYTISFDSLKSAIKANIIEDYFLAYCKSIVVISILFYILELIFNISIMGGHAGYGLLNIVGLPALEGIAGTLTSTFYPCVIIYVFIFSSSKYKYNSEKLFFLIISLLMILLCVKRTAYIVLLIGILLAFYKLKIKLYFKIFIAAIIMLTIFLFNQYLNIIFTGGVIDQDPFYSRSYLPSVIEYISNTSPVIGLGLGFHNYGFSIFTDSSLSDSSPLSFLVDSGLIGLFLFMYWMLYGAYRAYCHAYFTSNYSIFSIVLVFYLYSFVIDLFNNPFDLLPFFLIIFSVIPNRFQIPLHLKCKTLN